VTGPLGDLSPYLRAHARQYWVGGFSVLATVFFMLVNPRILAAAIDALRSGHVTPRGLVFYALAIAGAASLSAGFNLLQRRQMIVASRQIETTIRDDIYSHLTRLDRYAFDQTRTGDVMNRLTTDLGSVREMLGPGLNMGSRVILVSIGCLVGMLLLQPLLGGLVIVVSPVMIGAAATLRRMVAGRYGAAQGTLSDIAARVQEDFTGIRVLKGNAMEDRELAAFDALNERFVRENMNLARVEAALPSVMGLLTGTCFLIILLVGGRMVLFDRTLTVGGYVAFTTYLTLLSGPIVDVGRVFSIHQRGATSWGRLRQMLDVPARLLDPAAPEAFVRPAGDVELRHVTLRLRDRDVLKDVTLVVPAGSTVGITGRTGSGKTMLVNLIARLYDATSGTVRVGGVDVRELRLEDLRSRIGFAQQEPFLFSGTLAENLTYGLPHPPVPEDEAPPADLERATWAAEVAGLSGDIARFPAGLDTLLGERGVTLSGGQRGRAAIGRAVAKRPDILILDDALAAVDAETEQAILENLRRELAGGAGLGATTTFIVSHRVSALRLADRVIVLDGGEIVEEGRPADLSARGGLFADLEARQRLARAAGAEVLE
ncbi:MAG TPA: ABC transporter ATP-binding protein, partial [Deinococcales bacterium]|nr:ABC transporter ATP-binding protein [Deinococcales bacterium]